MFQCGGLHPPSDLRVGFWAPGAPEQHQLDVQHVADLLGMVLVVDMTIEHPLV